MFVDSRCVAEAVSLQWLLDLWCKREDEAEEVQRELTRGGFYETRLREGGPHRSEVEVK